MNVTCSCRDAMRPRSSKALPSLVEYFFFSFFLLFLLDLDLWVSLYETNSKWNNEKKKKKNREKEKALPCHERSRVRLSPGRHPGRRRRPRGHAGGLGVEVGVLDVGLVVVQAIRDPLPAVEHGQQPREVALELRALLLHGGGQGGRLLLHGGHEVGFCKRKYSNPT